MSLGYVSLDELWEQANTDESKDALVALEKTQNSTAVYVGIATAWARTDKGVIDMLETAIAKNEKKLKRSLALDQILDLEISVAAMKRAIEIVHEHTEDAAVLAAMEEEKKRNDGEDE